MSTIDWDLLQAMLTKVLTMIQKFLLKCTGENAHKNYGIVLPWKQAAWPDDWNDFVDGVTKLGQNTRYPLPVPELTEPEIPDPKFG